ncbi:hypothetical protein GCM10009801_16620 [Streptomyces albiaxialis]|uniref:Uncharacterized protein n=1 Tax=Streptomyces albiaxialis TaxID=329523 RepID=A0ABN2VPV1_9ACTN
MAEPVRPRDPQARGLNRSHVLDEAYRVTLGQLETRWVWGRARHGHMEHMDDPIAYASIAPFLDRADSTVHSFRDEHGLGSKTPEPRLRSRDQQPRGRGPASATHDAPSSPGRATDSA